MHVKHIYNRLFTALVIVMVCLKSWWIWQEIYKIRVALMIERSTLRNVHR